MFLSSKNIISEFLFLISTLSSFYNLIGHKKPIILLKLVNTKFRVMSSSFTLERKLVWFMSCPVTEYSFFMLFIVGYLFISSSRICILCSTYFKMRESFICGNLI